MVQTDISIPSFAPPKPKNLFLASEHGLHSYSDLRRYKNFFLRRLMDNRIDLSRPVGFLAHTSEELIMAIASCWQLGIPFVPLNPDATASELHKKIRALDLGVLIIEEDLDSKVVYQPQIPIRELDLQQALSNDWKSAEDIEDFNVETHPEQVFGYFFTSGTTDKPKVVPLKRRQMLFATAASAENFKPDPDHFWLLCLPLNHIGGVSIIIRSLLYGSGIYYMKRFDKEMVSTFLSENELFQVASLVPTMLKRLLDIRAFQTHKNFKAILLGGGPIKSSELKYSASKGIPVVSSYGMTETCAQIAANALLKPSGVYAPVKSVGRLFKPNEIEIRNDKRKPVNTNESGTIWLKGPQVFDGYLSEELNEQRFDDNGWFNTGDYGHLNLYGHLFIETRRSDLIISGGENVSPHEVEVELERLETIKEAAVLGIDDVEWGQIVVAAIVPVEDQKLDEQQLKNTLEDRLSSFKIPKKIRQLNELPKNRTGKVVRKELIRFFRD